MSVFVLNGSLLLLIWMSGCILAGAQRISYPLSRGKGSSDILFHLFLTERERSSGSARNAIQNRIPYTVETGGPIDILQESTFGDCQVFASRVLSSERRLKAEVESSWKLHKELPCPLLLSRSTANGNC